MFKWPRYPVIFELNTWTWLERLSRSSQKQVTLDSVPQAELDRLADLGFDGLWLMGVWQRSPAGRRIALEHPGLQAELARALPDYTQADVVGSPYAVHGYSVDEALGGNEALICFRGKLHRSGLGLILDFVPNHLAMDHPWVFERPELFVQGRASDLQNRPEEFFQAYGRVLAHGRDPFFPPWTDTVQLDYRRRETRRMMEERLLSLARHCDGLRCDMAMLVVREIFERTWGGTIDDPKEEFWPTAIAKLQGTNPGFLLLAEAYWDMESTLQQQGFDYVYDKRLSDRLTGRDPEPVQDHVRLAGSAFQSGLLRFLENHDEPRLASLLTTEQSKAAMVAAFILPGARLIHYGQMQGAVRRVPVQLGRGPEEIPDADLEDFCFRLLACLREKVFHDGGWRFLEAGPAWPESSSHRAFLAGLWEWREEVWISVVNLSEGRAQGRLPIDQERLAGKAWILEDRLNKAAYERDGDELLDPGLHVDLPGNGYHLFQLKPVHP